MKTCFIGHREINYWNIVDRLGKTIENEIKSGCKHFIMGTHGEFDEVALRICRRLRTKYRDIEIEVAITSLYQLGKRLLHDQFDTEYEKYYSDVQTVMYNIEEEHFKRKILVSNRKMIDECDTDMLCKQKA